MFKAAPAATSSKPSAVASMMPQASAQQDDEVDDEDGDDIEPVPVPRKTVIKKKIVTKK